MKLSSKYPLRQLTDFVDVIRGVTYDKTDQVLDETPNVILTADNITLDGHFEVSKKIYSTFPRQISKQSLYISALRGKPVRQ